MVKDPILKFKEAEVVFEEEPTKFKTRSVFDDNGIPEEVREPEVLGIKLRIGNEPIVRNLEELFSVAGKELPPEIKILFKDKDIYTITHAAGALRVKGRATVSELHYNAKILDVKGAQTIDMLPNTSFKTIWQVNANLQGAFKATGKFSADLPDNLLDKLTEKYVSLGGDMELQLSSDVNYVGKFSIGLKLPVSQAIGQAGNYCSWVLNPHENPLLGDQVLVQTLAVPKGTKKISYRLDGLIKADKGIFWKQQEISSPGMEVEVGL